MSCLDWIKEQSQNPELREIIGPLLRDSKAMVIPQEKLRRVIQVSLRPFLE